MNVRRTIHNADCPEGNAALDSAARLEGSGAPCFTPIAGSAVWYEFVGLSIHSDLDIDPVSGVVNPLATYTHRGTFRGVQDGGLIGTYDSAQRYFHGNHLGSTRFLSDAGGTAVSAVGYSAFGEVLGTNGTNLPRYGYAGAWGYQNDGLADPPHDIGLLHVGARYYEPASGRFIQRDPIGIFGGRNVFAYVGNSASNAIDPSGLISLPTITLASVTSVILNLSINNMQTLMRLELMVANALGNIGTRLTPAQITRLRDLVPLACKLLSGSFGNAN